jgi:hypothetical protein
LAFPLFRVVYALAPAAEAEGPVVAERENFRRSASDGKRQRISHR